MKVPIEKTRDFKKTGERAFYADVNALRYGHYAVHRTPFYPSWSLTHVPTRRAICFAWKPGPLIDFAKWLAEALPIGTQDWKRARGVFRANMPWRILRQNAYKMNEVGRYDG